MPSAALETYVEFGILGCQLTQYVARGSLAGLLTAQATPHSLFRSPCSHITYEFIHHHQLYFVIAGRHESNALQFSVRSSAAQHKQTFCIVLAAHAATEQRAAQALFGQASGVAARHARMHAPTSRCAHAVRTTGAIMLRMHACMHASTVANDYYFIHCVLSLLRCNSIAALRQTFAHAVADKVLPPPIMHAT